MDQKVLEKDITRDILTFLRGCGCFVWKSWQGPMGLKGISDILGCTPDGTMICVEVKRPKVGVATEEQKRFIRNAQRCGAIGCIASSVEEVEAMLAEKGIQSKQRKLF